MIRPIEAADAGLWVVMRGRLWPDADCAELESEARAFLAGRSQPLISAAFLAQGEGSEPVGFLELSVRPFSDGCYSMPIPHVEGWYVEPLARKRGFGRALMNAAEAWARNRGFTELASDAEAHNAVSERAHAACGFEEVERLIKYRKPLARGETPPRVTAEDDARKTRR